jgi:hypothetical protein
MKFKGFFTSALVFLFLVPELAQAQISLHGGRGLLRVQDGQVVGKGDLYVSAYGSAYFKKVNGLAKDYHFSLVATYGLSYFTELVSRLVLYQDDQAHIWGPIGDTEIGIKIRIPTGLQQFWALSFQNTVILPTAPNHNVQYEPYTSEYVTWKPGLNTSLDFLNVSAVPFKIYANAGLIDRHLTLKNLFAARDDQYYLAAGIKFSLGNVVLYGEYYTEQFLNRKTELTFEQNYQVATTGLTFLGPYNLILTIAGEFNTMKVVPESFFRPKDIAKWKIWVGITKYVSVGKYLSETAERRRQERKRLEELKKQQLIKDQRVRAQEEMKKMQEKLKKKKKKKEQTP